MAHFRCEEAAGGGVMNTTGTLPKRHNTVLTELSASLLFGAFIIKFYSDNLEAAMQAGNRSHAVFWQAKMYAAIKARNAALGVTCV
jgi:hypothetical protein